MSDESERFRILGKKISKGDKIRGILYKALAECDTTELEEVKRAISSALSKLEQNAKKNFRKIKIGEQMAELAKNKQAEWWAALQAGLKPKPSLDVPNIKKEKDEFK